MTNAKSLDAKGVKYRDIYDCPAGAFMIIGQPIGDALHIVWLADGAERDVSASKMFNCRLVRRGEVVS